MGSPLGAVDRVGARGRNAGLSGTHSLVPRSFPGGEELPSFLQHLHTPRHLRDEGGWSPHTPLPAALGSVLSLR